MKYEILSAAMVNTGDHLPHTAIPPLAGNFDLGDSEVHIWHFDVQNFASSFPWDTLLNEEERQRAKRFHFAQDRTCFVTCRSVLRALLGAYLRSEPRRLRFETSDKGKPALCQPDMGESIHFNISHSGNLALMGFVRRREVGVDVEQIRTDFNTAAIAERFFSVGEKARLAQLPAESRQAAFFRIWTLKEALSKAKGGGLSMFLLDFEVSIEPGWAAELLATRSDPAEADRWHLESLQVAANYAAALVVERSARQRPDIKVQALRLVP